MVGLKSLAHNWLPPAVTRWLRKRSPGVIRFEGDFPSWEVAAEQCTGYDAPEILDRILEATLKVKRGEALFERDSVLFDRIEYAWPVLAGLMWAAARNAGKLNVLDFGGALGSSYFQNRKLLQSLPDMRWNVVEQRHFVEVGKARIQDDQLRFFRTIEESLAESRPNVILASSVLQYLPDPIEIMNKLPISGADCLVIDRTPFADCANDRLMVQRVPPAIYSATYPMWVFSKSRFLAALEDEWRLVASSMSPEGQQRSEEGFK
jgi:putative methyltransferase (TIGR04325 family)